MSTELEDDWQEVEGSISPLSASSGSGQSLVVKDDDDEVASRHLEEQIREQLTLLNERHDAALASHLPWNSTAATEDSTSSFAVADPVVLPEYPSSYGQPLPSIVQLSEDYASGSFVSSAAVHPNSERTTLHDEFVEQCDEEDIVEDSPTGGDGLLSSLSTVGSSNSSPSLEETVNVDVHFTSPIRRYADVIVHRQLLDSLESQRRPEASFNDSELGELCQHINTKHRSSKQAQRDSVELFQALYFAKRPSIEDAIIYDIKANGFLVLVHKYGIRGTVYLRDKEGHLLIPSNALSLMPKQYQSKITVSKFNMDELDGQQMILHTSLGPLAVRVFDHLTVKITVIESRSHR